MVVELLNITSETLGPDHPINLFSMRTKIALATGQRLDLVHFERINVGKVDTRLADPSLSGRRVAYYSEEEIDGDLTGLITSLTGNQDGRSDIQSAIYRANNFQRKQEWPTLQPELVIGTEVRRDSTGWRRVTWYVRGTKNDDRLSVGKILRFLAGRR